MVKRKPKRRPQHRLAYYMSMLPTAETDRQILDLVMDAAKQPKRILSDADYEQIYWRAHGLLDKKGE